MISVVKRPYYDGCGASVPDPIVKGLDQVSRVTKDDDVTKEREVRLTSESHFDCGNCPSHWKCQVYN